MGSPASSIAGGGGEGAAGSGIEAPASSTDNGVVTWNGTDADAQNDTPVTITAAGVVAGATQLNVDNIRLDGNVVSTTNANGNLTVTPNGTGVIIASAQVQVPAGTAPAPGLGFSTDPESGLVSLGNGVIGVSFDGSRTWELRATRFVLQRNDGFVVLGSDENFGLGWAAAGIGKLCVGTSGLGAVRGGQEVIARTTDLTLTTAESGITYTNTGAGGQVIFTLPPATLTNNVGWSFGFVVRAAQNMRVVAPGADVIQLNTVATAAGGRIDSNTVGGFVFLFVAAAGVVQAVDAAGTFTAT